MECEHITRLLYVERLDEPALVHGDALALNYCFLECTNHPF